MPVKGQGEVAVIKLGLKTGVLADNKSQITFCLARLKKAQLSGGIQPEG